MRPKVSVIPRAYNSREYIEQTIKGVIHQRAGFGIRHVISDDCSTDGTHELCLEWQRRRPDIIDVRRNGHNLGLQANFMAAYAHCDGEYIAMCDGDDYWCDRDKLRLMVGYMDAHPDCAVAFHRVINYFEDNGTKSLSNGGQRKLTTIEDLARSNTITNCSVIYRRDNVPELPDWISEVKLCDYAMHILNACHGYVRYFNRPMAVYRQRSNAEWSLMGLHDREKKLGMALDVRERLIDHLPHGQDAVREIIRDAHTRFALAEAAFSLAHGLDDAAARLTRRVMAYRPGWTQDDFDAALARATASLRPTARTRLTAMLKGARAAVSRCIPLPRP